MPRSYKARDIPCTFPRCSQWFTNRAGLTNHIRSKHRYDSLAQDRIQARLSSPTRNLDGGSSPNHDRNSDNDNFCNNDDFFDCGRASDTRSSPEPGSRSKEEVCVHEGLSGEYHSIVNRFLQVLLIFHF